MRYWREIRASAPLFMRRRPAFLAALSLYLGFVFSVQGCPCLSIIFLLSLLLPLSRRQQFVGCAIWLATVAAGMALYREPTLPKEGWRGQAEVEIVSVARNRALFGKGWSYKARLRNFTCEGESRPSRKVKGVPLFLSSTKRRHLANCDYLIPGTLVAKRRGLSFKPSGEWERVEGSWSLAEWRHKQHQRVEEYLHSRMEDEEGAALLSGLLVGELCNIQTLFDFGHLGLQHMMAISGFHFSMIGASIAWLLRLMLPRRWAALVLGLLLTYYFLLVGVGPATQRAWIAAIVAILGVVVGRKSDALNTLGLAGIGVLLWDPAACKSLGFQFSFAATGAILLYTQPVERWLSRCFSSLTLGQVQELGPVDQHGYLLLVLVRRALALAIAVHSVVIPLSLCLFHRFSLLGLFYNLLFPFLLSLLILLLPWIALLDLLFHRGFSIADGIVRLILDMAHLAPTAFDYVVRVDWIGGGAVAVWLLLLLVVRMRNKEIAPLDPLRL